MLYHRILKGKAAHTRCAASFLLGLQIFGNVFFWTSQSHSPGH